MATAERPPKGMHDSHRPIGPREALAATLILSAATYSWFAAAARPFTTSADVFCSVAFAGIAVVIFVTRVPRASSRTTRADPASESFRSFLPWIVIVSLIVVWEIGTYCAGLGGSRHNFPTISSLYDEGARFHAVKASLFFLWLMLGWRMFRG
jgi:hypothetical protein